MLNWHIFLRAYLLLFLSFFNTDRVLDSLFTHSHLLISIRTEYLKRCQILTRQHQLPLSNTYLGWQFRGSPPARTKLLHCIGYTLHTSPPRLSRTIMSRHFLSLFLVPKVGKRAVVSSSLRKLWFDIPNWQDVPHWQRHKINLLRSTSR